MQDTGRSFEPIFMKFALLVRIHPWMNPIAFGNNQPKGRYRLSNVFCGTATTAAMNMMFESLGKNACGTNCRRGWAEPAFCGKECFYVRPENRQFWVCSAAIQLRLRTYSQHVRSMFADCPH